MCGRFALVTTKERIRAQFGVDELPDLIPRFNICPSQQVLLLVQVEDSIHAVMFKWGLIPFWAKDKKIGAKLANARAETVTVKPAFRNAFKSKRGLMIMSGFYEWQQTLGMKQPYYFKKNNDDLLAIAALWDSWQSNEGDEVIQSCCLLTTGANALMSTVHNRMPVILSKDEQQEWLDTKHANPAALRSFLKPYPRNDLDCYPVTTQMNNTRYDEINAISPIRIKNKE